MADSFGYLFLLSRRFEYITDQILKKDGLTTKQLLFLITISSRASPEPPSISQIADILCTGHQNVKQIATQLDKKGFIKMVRDEHDKRRWLLTTTKKNQDYWDSKAQEHTAAMFSLFRSLTQKEVQDFYNLLLKLYENTEEIYTQARMDT